MEKFSAKYLYNKQVPYITYDEESKLSSYALSTSLEKADVTVFELNSVTETATFWVPSPGISSAVKILSSDVEKKECSCEYAVLSGWYTAGLKRIIPAL